MEVSKSMPSKRPGEEPEERQMGVYRCQDCGQSYLTKNALSGHYAESDCQRGAE